MLGENLMICFNVLDAARRAGLERILYTSTVTVYPPMEIYREDLVWLGNPHPGDQYAAWAKRMAEKFIEAQEIQYGSQNTAIVRPVNTFGPHDNFDPKTALVVPALIGRALSGENPFVVWGDGSAVRDFLYVSDAVDGIQLAFEKGIGKGAFNLGLLMRRLIGAGTPKGAVARGWYVFVLLPTTNGATYAAILMVLVANRVVPALIVFTSDCDHRLGGTTTSSTGC